ncbi:hypothetical protein ACSHWO_01175 [Streptomyces sp. HUAS TT3]|uniref:hypothetical protein n=1 Tax=Streptomyces sp. HUAS TT3 TaxID=3447510 RepID=UPI003F65CE17
MRGRELVATLRAARLPGGFRAGLGVGLRGERLVRRGSRREHAAREPLLEVSEE